MSITRKIAVGDRVAIAPHHDLWMQGARYATVINEQPSTLTLELDSGRRVTVDRLDVLAPVSFTLNDGA